VLASIYRESLEKYYARAFGQGRAVRLGSIAMIAGITVWLGVWSVAASALWAVAYLTSELAMVLWWAKIQPRLQASDADQVLKLHASIVTICAASCAISAAPCFFTPLAGHNGQVIGMVLSAGILLFGVGAHVLKPSMFYFTTPAAAIALVWNLFSLGSGPAAWMFAFMGVCFVINARVLQKGNANVFLELIKTHVVAEAANKAKSEFLANMSHEIRTPLNGVLGMVQVMERDTLPSRQRERLALIGQSGETLLAILNDILDLSKVEAGKLELEDGAFELEPLALAVRQTFEPMANSKGLEFTLEVEAEARNTYRGDTVRVRQVLNNLISNALKFTRAGSVKVWIGVVDDRVRFSVTDTGIGVTPAQIERLFEKFVQADSSTTRRFGGTGLGLAICQELCRAMGGEISVESEVGVGSRFVADLPLARVAPAGPVPATAATPQAAIAERPLRVLAAEDNAMNQVVLQTLLAQAGLDPVIVGNGEEAVAAWEEGDWDIILMDVQMPVMDGVMASRQIRRREAQTGRPATPIIALTANAMRHQTDGYVAAGMNGVVAKPIVVGQLFETMAAAMEGQPGHERAAVSA